MRGGGDYSVLEHIVKAQIRRGSELFVDFAASLKLNRFSMQMYFFEV